MSIDSKQLRDLVCETLEMADLFSLQAVELILGTAAVESNLGTYIKQIGHGPALGIFQMEVNTMFDIYNNFLGYRPELLDKIETISGVKDPSGYSLKTNLSLQILLCRVHYMRKKDPLPAADDIEKQGEYWKDFYNTYLGSGTVEKYVSAYNRYLA